MRSLLQLVERGHDGLLHHWLNLGAGVCLYLGDFGS